MTAMSRWQKPNDRVPHPLPARVHIAVWEAERSLKPSKTAALAFSISACIVASTLHCFEAAALRLALHTKTFA